MRNGFIEMVFNSGHYFNGGGYVFAGHFNQTLKLSVENFFVCGIV
jgi:hypothetical protein